MSAPALLVPPPRRYRTNIGQVDKKADRTQVTTVTPAHRSNRICFQTEPTLQKEKAPRRDLWKVLEGVHKGVYTHTCKSVLNCSEVQMPLS